MPTDPERPNPLLADPRFAPGHPDGHGADNELARAMFEGRLGPIRPSRACSSCVFSAPPANAPVGAPMECRRHPPVVGIVRLKTGALPPGLDLGGMQQPEEVLQALTNFPSVQPDQWCGEYESTAESTAEPTAADS